MSISVGSTQPMRSNSKDEHTPTPRGFRETSLDSVEPALPSGVRPAAAPRAPGALGAPSGPAAASPPGGRPLLSRYECKYLIPRDLVEPIRVFSEPFVQPDPYALRSPDRRYWISSLYLDSRTLDLFRMNEEGWACRYKLRVRSYSDDPESPVFFEIKRRVDGVIQKVRARQTRDVAEDFLRTCSALGAGRPVATDGFDEFATLARSIQAEPLLRVRYQREAYESRGFDPVRLTFDYDVASAVTHGPDLSVHTGPWEPTDLDGVVLELKFTDLFPSWLNQMIARFDLDRCSLAKYAISLEQALEHGRIGNRRSF